MRMRGFHICFGGPVRSVTLPSGKVMQYEAHPYHGPIALNKNGDPLAAQPGERHPFWQAVEAAGVPPTREDEHAER